MFHTNLAGMLMILSLTPGCLPSCGGFTPDVSIENEGELLTFASCDEVGADVFGSRGTHIVLKGARPYLVDRIDGDVGLKVGFASESEPHALAVPGVAGLKIGGGQVRLSNGNQYRVGQIVHLYATPGFVWMFTDSVAKAGLRTEWWGCSELECSLLSSHEGWAPFDRPTSLTAVFSDAALEELPDFTATVSVQWSGRWIEGGVSGNSAVVWQRIGDHWENIFSFQPIDLTPCGFGDFECNGRSAGIVGVCPLPDNGIAIITATASPNYSNALWLATEVPRSPP